jgi:hypothetical protein
MYNFIFYVMFNYQISKGSSFGYARFNASLILSLSILLHYLALLSIIKGISGVSQYDKILTNKVFMIVGLFGGCLLFVRHYNEEKIQNMKSNPVYLDSITNKLLVFFNIAGSIAIIFILARNN